MTIFAPPQAFRYADIGIIAVGTLLAARGVEDILRKPQNDPFKKGNPFSAFVQDIYETFLGVAQIGAAIFGSAFALKMVDKSRQAWVNRHPAVSNQEHTGQSIG
jgi:hypothetical protein